MEIGDGATRDLGSTVQVKTSTYHNTCDVLVLD
jgi:hypothetical protein